MKTIVANAFSYNMFDWNQISEVTSVAKKLSLEEFADELKKKEWTSSIGHGDMAGLLTKITGVEIPMNKCNDKLIPGDVLLVAQYTGPRLPEGATQLPEGASIVFLKCEIK